MTFIIALSFLVGMVWDSIESRYAASLAAATQIKLDSDVVVLSLGTFSNQTEASIDVAPDIQNR